LHRSPADRALRAAGIADGGPRRRAARDWPPARSWWSIADSPTVVAHTPSDW